MGEYADYQIELDDAEFARQSAADYEKSRPKVICKICQRHIKPSGLKDHMRDKHAATPQPVIAPELASLKNIANQLRKAGASIPMDNEGTIESAMKGGLSIALMLVEDAISKPVIAPEWVMLTEDEIQTIVLAAGTGWTHADVPTVRALITAFIAKQNGIL